jgi:hypothetical protein
MLSDITDARKFCSYARYSEIVDGDWKGLANDAAPGSIWREKTQGLLVRACVFCLGYRDCLNYWKSEDDEGKQD